MIRFFTESLVRSITLLRAHRGFLYTLALLVVIPVAFLWSGQQFLTVARDHHTRSEYNRIGLFHDSVVAYVAETNGNVDGVRRMAERIASLNPDVRHIALVTFEDQNFTQAVLAGTELNLSDYGDMIRAASVRTDESIVFESYERSEHVRVGVRALAREGALPNQFLVTTFSLSADDALYQHAIRVAYAYLAGIVFLIMLLIVRHARIINYAELYGELKQALAAKTTFITMTAHELRSPLTAMRGYASLLRESGALSDEAKEYARRIEESSAYMIGLVSDMLDVAKMESGGALLASDTIRVKDVIEQLVTRLESLGIEHGITLTSEPIADDMHIVVDRTRLEQILTNLISNALKYTKEGSVTLAANVVHGKCEIRIKDTGMGMTAEDQHKLFSPYFRTEDAESSKIVGTGLGMWITKQFIEKMGGTVDVESIHGIGTHVVVIFPLAKVS